jgi:hypothetical protein
MAPTTSPMHICSDLQSGSPSPRITLVPRSSAFSLSDQTSTPSSTSGAIVYPSSTGSSGLSSTGMTILGAVLVGGLLIAIFAILLCLGSARIHSGINPLSSSLSERSTMRGEIHDLAGKKTHLAQIWLNCSRTDTTLRNGNFSPSSKSPSSKRRQSKDCTIH